MKANRSLLLLPLLFWPLPASGEIPPSAEDLLRKGLFEEEANQDLDQAEKHYRALVEAHRRDRALAATALFRLGEIARKREQKNTAIGHYQDLIAQFPEATDLVRLSKQNLAGLGATAPGVTSPLVGSTDKEEAAELARLQRLFRESPDLVDGPDSLGWYPLHFAAENGWSRVTSFLIAQGVDVDARAAAAGNSGLTATHLATIHGHLAILRQLLDAGAKRDLLFNPEGTAVGLLPPVPTRFSISRGSRSLLDQAIIYDRTAIIDFLLAGKPEEVAASLNRTGPVTGVTLTGFVEFKSLKLTPVQLALLLDREAIAIKLIEKGAPIGPVGDDEQPSALLFAALFRRPFATWLLAQGADPNLGHPATGIMPLHEAIYSQELELAQALIKAGAKVDAATAKGSTPLHFASSAEAVILLLDNGAEINAETLDGMTPLEAVGTNGKTDAARAAFDFLLEKGATCKNPERLVTKAGFLLPDVLEHFVYPQAVEADTIQLAERGTHAQLKVIETRRTEALASPPLSDVLAMHYLRRSRTTSKFDRSIGSLRVLRASTNGGIDIVFAAHGAEVSKAEFPDLRWGDLVEVNVLLGAETKLPADSPRYNDLLNDRIKPRQVAFRVAGLQTVLTVPAKTSSSNLLKSWKAIDLRSLFEDPFTGFGVNATQLTIQREGLEKPLSFKMAEDLVFRLADRDRVTIPFPPTDKGAFLFRSSNPLNPIRIDNRSRTLLDTLAANTRGGSHTDWRRVEIRHASAATGKRTIDIDELVRTLARGKWHNRAWDEHDYTLRDGCIIVLHPLSKQASKANQARAAETTKLLSDIHDHRGSHSNRINRVPKTRSLP